MSDVKDYALTLLMLSVHLVTLVDCHPQCLDFRAPFRPETTLNFCTNYSKLGCCGSNDDYKIQEEYEFIRSRVTGDEWKRCHSYIQDILCQKCSPFAAHIYDAEGTSKARKFPGICTSYCNDFYEKCRHMIWLLDPSLVTTGMTGDKHRFCQQVAITDEVYCYPDLLTSPLLLRNLTAVHPYHTNATAGCLCLETIRDNLANPLWARHARDGSSRLFVAEQQGRVRVYNTKTKRWNKKCFLDFTKKTVVGGSAGDERGFLGMAFHPSYSSNGRFFVYYITSRKPGDALPPELRGLIYPFETKIVISEGRVSRRNPNRADRNYERVLLEVVQPYENHNGGELMFGLDGYLYAFIGDGGGAGDPMKAGQNKSLLHGKVIRLDVNSDPTQPYTIPHDNPFVSEVGSRPEIYAYGIRNIWRCGLDQGGESRGRIVCGDVGQNAYEEIDIIKKGANYGWNAREGFECYDDELCGRIGREELPIHAYAHRIGQSVTGGVFYRGCENPALLGQYLYGDYVSGRLFSLTEAGGAWTNNDVHLCGPALCQGGFVGESNNYILSFGEDENGEIYMLTSKSSSSNKCDGTIYKIVDPVRRNDPSSCNSDLTHKKRLSLPKRKVATETDKAKSNLPFATITITVRRGKGSSKDNATLQHSFVGQQLHNNQGNQSAQFSPSSLSALLHNGNTEDLDSKSNVLSTAVGEKHSATFTTLPVITAPGKFQSNQGQSTGGTGTQQSHQQELAKQAPSQQRRGRQDKAKRRGNRKQKSKSKKQKCGAC